MGKFGTGWSLAKACISVLMHDKKIVILPIMMLALLALEGAAITALIGSTLNLFFPGQDINTLTNKMIVLGIFFLIGGAIAYISYWFLICFFTSAVIECARIRFNGKVPTLEAGLRLAWQHKYNLFKWSLVMATFGIFVRRMENISIGGKIGGTISKVVWSFLSFFVLPVMLYENLSPMQALARSIELLRKSLSEVLGGSIRLGSLAALLFVLGLVPTLYLGTQNYNRIALGFFFSYMIILLVFSAALHGILASGFYIYATKGKLPEKFKAYKSP